MDSCKHCEKPIVKIENVWYHQDGLHPSRLWHPCGVKEPVPYAEPK